VNNGEIAAEPFSSPLEGDEVEVPLREESANPAGDKLQGKIG